ncbi:response regulator receiver protein [Catenulispora acidiphila DSM 44928]|uniref:Response regulator receiver protein n=1 Tax=Catenulispora acidiphila (strain DSM 44928 / JCM 14897 / NBRC 102108 / NRRL B-24433 / ID139908) TaxID=479433 RepID=C7QI30_CATAD|nr:response regulator receiver protein [Catenulispora acidiphila]ACU73075.1 response regulator receiver protein [Catenulispora acidiphila DSM 44928]
MTTSTVTEQLISLAEQARHWQDTLVRATAEIAALTTPPRGDATEPDTAGVRTALATLAGTAGQTAWLRSGTPVPHRDGDVVAEALLRPGDRVRALLSVAEPQDAVGSAAPCWANSKAEIHAVGCAPSASALPETLPAYDLVLADRRVAMVISAEADGSLRAYTVIEPVVAILGTVWDAMWARSLPLASALRMDVVARDDVKAAILGYLEAGAKDEVIARALGMSLRTCRRHIAELLAAAGSVSRYQAASRFARAGLCSVQ